MSYFREDRTKWWDVFRTIPLPDGNNSRDAFFDKGMIFMKLIYMGLSFVLTLGCTLISKATLFIAVSSTQAMEKFGSRPLYCESFRHVNWSTVNETVYFKNYTRCSLLPKQMENITMSLTCTNGRYVYNLLLCISKVCSYTN